MDTLITLFSLFDLIERRGGGGSRGEEREGEGMREERMGEGGRREELIQLIH